MDERNSNQVTRCNGVEHPEPAHLLLETQNDSEDEDLEATELRSIDCRRLSRIISSNRPAKTWYDPIRRYWRHEIRISVPHVDCRDHLANERTFLGYLRTSIAVSMMGTVIAQLYRLQHSPDPNQVFGYFVLSKPLSVIFQVAALSIVLLGGIRFWRQQSAMALGKVHAGGWEVLGVGVGMLLLLVTVFALLVAVDLVKADEDEPW